jgi:hypothetical protein
LLQRRRLLGGPASASIDHADARNFTEGDQQ